MDWMRLLRELLAALIGGSALLLSPQQAYPESLEGESIKTLVGSEPRADKRMVKHELRRLAREARQALRGAATPSEARERFNRFFFSQAGFKPASNEEAVQALWVHRVLETRTGNCVGLAQIYLILSNRLDLPVVGTATPTHLLVRWRDGVRRINTELLELGAEHSDDEYRKRYRIHEPDPENPIFLRDLEESEVIARIYNNRGVIHSRAGRLGPAAADYSRALELDPRFPAPHYNRGLDHLNAGRPGEAIADFDAALALHPLDAWALNNRALARMRLGQSAEAAGDLQKALSIEPDLASARKNLEIMKTKGWRSQTRQIPAQPIVSVGEIGDAEGQKP